MSPGGDVPKLYVNHKRLGLTPLSAEGDGFRRAILIAAAAIAARGGLLLVDEIEIGLHREALVAVYSLVSHLCQRHDVRLVATTHSIEAVDALLEAADPATEDLVVHHLPALHSGAAIKRFAGEQLHRLRFERGLDVR